MRERRKADRSALQNRRQMQQPRSLEGLKKAAVSRKKKRIEDIRDRASKGDMHALQVIALEKEIHCRGRHLVVDIEIHEADFERRVVEQLENESRKR